MKKLGIVTALFGLYTMVLSSVAPGRNFKAVRPAPSMHRRSLGLQPSLSTAEVLYIEDTLNSPSPLGARVSFSPKLPALLLDEIDFLFSHISCDDSRITLSFETGYAKQEALVSWSNESDFLIVTSATACAKDGAHQMYKISSMVNTPDSLELKAEKTTIKEYSDDVRVQLSEGIYHKLANEHNDLRRRDSTGTLRYPHPTGASEHAPTSATQNIAKSYKNQKIIPSPWISKSVIPQGVILSCVECSTTGSLEISNGDFGFDADTDTGLNGHLDFIARGVKAHVELELKLLPGFLKAEYVAQLPAIPIPDLGLAGVGGAIGAYVVMDILMGVEFDSTIEFTGGFELEIPDGAHIHVDVGNPGKSYDHGFTKSKLNALPFNMHTSPPVFKFYAALQPHMQVGIQTTNTSVIDANVGVGVFMNAPRMQMSIGEVSHVNEQCEPTKSHPVDHPLIHVVPQVSMNVGVEAEAEVEHVQMQTATVLTQVSYPLPTACLDFDPHAKSLHVAGAPHDSKTGAAMRAVGGRRGCQEMTMGILAFAMTGFIAGWL